MAAFLRLVVITIAFAASASQAEDYNYPELEVTPRASKRLAKEAKEEESRSWTSHLPIQSSSLITLAAAVMASGDSVKPDDSSNADDVKDAKEDEEQIDNAAQLGMLIGGGWIATTVILSATYRPYKTCLASVSSIKVKSKKDALERERAAEECLNAPASLASKLNLLSMSTNFLAGAYIASVGDDDFTVVMGALAALSSVTPYLFSYHWQDVQAYHEDYKKRIYGPITGAGVLFNEQTQKLAPALMASIKF